MSVKKSTAFFAVALVALLGISPLAWGQRVIYVDADATGAGGGSSWADAFTDVQSAVLAAMGTPAGTQVWVAAGRYVGPIVSNWGVELHGGFAGDEHPAEFDLGNRDFVANETILDGDNVHRVLILRNSEGGVARVDGFTITGSTISGIVMGGALLLSDASAALANNTVAGNHAGAAGGALYFENYHLDSSAPTIRNSIVAFNSSGLYRQNPTVFPLLAYNCVYGNDAYDYAGLTDGTGHFGNFSADPLFVSPPEPGPDGVWGTTDDIEGDLHLLPDSSCIDAGDPESDFGREPEPNGNRINLGAYGNTPEAASHAWVSLGGYERTRRTRLGPSLFEYELVARIHNESETEATNVRAGLLDSPDFVTVLDPIVTIGDVPAGATITSGDGFVLQVDHAEPLPPLTMVWMVSYKLDGATHAETTTVMLHPQDLSPAAGGRSGELGFLICPRAWACSPIEAAGWSMDGLSRNESHRQEDRRMT